MFDRLFTIIDIPLICILIMLMLFAIFYIQNIYNIFLSIFTALLLLIFITSTVLTQQRFLAEFLIISTFFILAIIFFVFHLGNNFDNSLTLEEYGTTYKTYAFAIMFVLLFMIIGFNFYVINYSTTSITTNTASQSIQEINKVVDVKIQNKDAYLENIALLNQNKIFQKLTHIVLFYVCLTVILYFYNKGGDADEW